MIINLMKSVAAGFFFSAVPHVFGIAVGDDCRLSTESLEGERIKKEEIRLVLKRTNACENFTIICESVVRLASPIICSLGAYAYLTFRAMDMEYFFPNTVSVCIDSYYP